MRRLHSLIIAILTFLGASAQTAPTTVSEWADRLDKFGKTIPQEQVFVHMDNNCYFLGDTIYYKAYVRRSDTGRPSRVSGVLYTELFNQEGYLIERQQLELSNGQAHGTFVLQDSLYGGYYELRAYTRWQLNWGEYQHNHTFFSEQWFYNNRMAKEYYRDYEKLYSRVFPVFDAPKEPGEFFHDMTLRPLRRISKVDESDPRLKLQLYPEGGNLVAGASCRVAFETTSNDGLHQEGSVVITDNSGNKVAEAKTEQRGRGLLTFTPESGKSYTATYTGKKGSVKENLPDIQEEGCAIQVKQADGKTTVELTAVGSAASEKLGMTIMSDGVMLDFQELSSGSQTVTVDPSKLQTGVCQITVFDKEGRIYADRLFFCRKADLEPSSVSFTGINNKPVEPFSPIDLGVQGKAGTTLSLSVRDASHTEYLYDNGNILTEMLLSSQIRGFVEDPGYFFEKDDEEHNRALDLLLMIQGWRRYDWHTMTTPGAFVLNHKPEQTPLLVGEVNKYIANEQESLFVGNFEDLGGSNGETAMAHDIREENGMADIGTEPADAVDGGSVTAARANVETTGRENNAGSDRLDRFVQNQGEIKRELLVHATFVKPNEEGKSAAEGEMMTEGHRFSIPQPRFYEGCFLHLSASDSTKWKGKPHVWQLPGTDRNDHLNYPEYYVRLRPYFPRFVKPYNFYQCHLSQAPRGSAMAQDWMLDGARTLDEVTVGVKRARMMRFDASKPAFVIDAYEAFNEACDAGFCTGYFQGSNRFARDVARTYIGDMNLAREYDLDLRLDGKKQAAQSAINRERTHIGGTIEDMPNEEFNISPKTKEMYNLLKYLGKVYIYTDYSPRREGNDIFAGENIPEVTIDLHLIDQSESTRTTNRDRRYILPGFSAPEEFYQPDYSTKPLPEVKDYRRTLYWNPDLQLDANGKANVRFYNNGKQTHIAISAEGMADDGTLQTGKSMPEDRLFK